MDYRSIYKQFRRGIRCRKRLYGIGFAVHMPEKGTAEYKAFLAGWKQAGKELGYRRKD